jgi:glycerol uptake operon antiterminator
MKNHEQSNNVMCGRSRNLGSDILNNEILADIKKCPVIAAIRDIDDVDMALSRKIQCVFLLTGSILNIKYVVHCIKKARKRAFLHIDLVEGISKDSEGTKYIVEEIRPDGIITTRSNLGYECTKYGYVYHTTGIYTR